MNELKIKFDFSHGPIWKDKFDRDTGEFYTGIAIVDNDKALNVLNEEASREYSALYHFDENNRYIFDEEAFETMRKAVDKISESVEKTREFVDVTKKVATKSYHH